MNHHLESLGWTLVHFCWQAAAIALVYWLTDGVLRKARSQTRYVLALVTMLLMLVSALATFAYEETRGDTGSVIFTGRVFVLRNGGDRIEPLK